MTEPELPQFVMNAANWELEGSPRPVGGVGKLEITICDFKFMGGRRKVPYAFTEQGVAMLSGVLTSPRAVAVNVATMRAFVKLRRLMAFEAEIRQRFEAIEHKAGEQDAWIAFLYQAIEDLMKPPDPEPKRVGFRPDET